MKMIFTFCSVFVFLFIFNTTTVKAAPCYCPPNNKYLGDVAEDVGRDLQKNCSGGNGSDTPISLPNPLTGKTTYDEKTEGIPVLLGNIINSVLGIIGSLALVMFIYGGATWMLSAGSQEQVTKGKNILIWATVGIVIIFTAYALVKFVLTTVTG